MAMWQCNVVWDAMLLGCFNGRSGLLFGKLELSSQKVKVCDEWFFFGWGGEFFFVNISCNEAHSELVCADCDICDVHP